MAGETYNEKDTRSIAEVIMDGDGNYDELIAVDKLSDGTFLVYEKQKCFGFSEGYIRVNRLDPDNKDYFLSAKGPYNSWDDNTKLMRALNDYLLQQKLQKTASE